MKLTFEYPKGVTVTLVKHNAVRDALKHGRMTEAEARTKAWYLRPSWSKNKPFKLAAADADAIRQAKDLLKGRDTAPGEFSAFLQAREAKRSATIGDLAAQWSEAGYPFSKTEPRDPTAKDQMHDTMTRALNWWREKRVSAITRPVHDDFVVWRRSNNKRAATSKTAGSRAADLELGALSCLCQWAMNEGLIEKNPFADRARYHDADNVKHCHQFRPETDEELHRILAWHFTKTYEQSQLSNRHKARTLELLTKLAGGWLAFTALTGLRPEEPAFLYRGDTLTQPPAKPAALPPGTIFPDRDGVIWMKIVRTKHGQNPFVHVHVVLAQFLGAWNSWLDAQDEFKTPATAQTGRPLFPSPTAPTRCFCPVTTNATGVVDVDTTALNKRLDQCCAELKLERRKPKGVGRAFYVAVRRSAGKDDAAIAGELGQTTNGALIRTTYGNPDDLRGGKLFDWLPDAPAQCAWLSLKPAAVQTNVVKVAFNQ